MASKNKQDDRPGSAEGDENIFQACSTSASTGMSLPAVIVGKKSRKVPDATHGLKFESKLLTLFCVRALEAGYTFELTKEREDLGGKFDDVIFRYQVLDDTPTGKHWRYRYLQAKHKLNELEMIKANDLLKDKDDSFSLPKYFRSFCKMRTRDEDIQDCILCTNIGFDSIDLDQKRIQLVSIQDQPEDILEFGPGQNTTRYKLKFAEDIRIKTSKEWSDIHHLAKQLQICATNQTTADMRTGVFISSYHVALVRERVIDSFTKEFHADFVTESMDLTNGAKHLRQAINELVNDEDWKTWKFKLSNNFGKSRSAAEIDNSLPLEITDKEIDDFFDKLVFVVNMPNEKKFENILQSEDVSKYYPKSECSDQTLRILHEIPNKFSDKDVGYWLTSEEGKKILLAGVTKVSLQYQKQLENEVGFHVDASQEMTVKLRDLLSSNNTVERIETLTPRYTSVKVISAIQILKREHDAKVTFLLMSSTHLQVAEHAQRWKNIFQLPNEFGHFVLLICDEGELSLTDDDYANLFSSEEEKTQRSKVIVISRNAATLTSDAINYTQLSDSFKQKILSKIVSFQGTNESVSHLVGIQQEDVLDSLEELLRPEIEKIVIPSFDTSRFEKSLYIKRQVKFAFDAENFNAELAKRLNCTADELFGQCRISSQGRIKWLVDGQRRQNIWKEIKTINDPTSKQIEETNHFFRPDDDKKEQQVIIICGVAGTGKSTLLSHYYDEIKKTKPDYWIIKVNLVEHCEAISKLDKKRPELIKFLINDLHVIDSKSTFSCSLLNHRLETGDRIVFMFDGFDEITNQCQETAIQLMKTIRKKKNIQLYVTVRPHMADNLQYELCQLAYTLENFSKNDQINYVASYWMKELKLSEDNGGVFKAFAKLLVTRVSETLKDEEQSFIGIPLQCRILAECYCPHIDEIVRGNVGFNVTDHSEDVLSQQLLALLDNQKFDSISLYSRLMDTKRKVFREEKTNSVSTSNQIMTDAMDSWTRKIESRLTKLAFETIITEPNIMQLFWPPKSSHKSVEDEVQQENTLAVNILRYGLTFSTEGGILLRPQQFLHRTFAEYLVAKYLYEGFSLDDRRHNKLLENESIRKLILNKILATEQYDGVQVFFDSMMKKLVDEDEEWRNTIDRRNVPNRLKKFTENLFTQFLRHKSKLYVIGKRSKRCVINRFSANALHFALLNAKGNIFKFLCDCLESTFEKRQIRWAIVMGFEYQYNCFPYIFFQESKLFKRCIDYVDIDAEDQLTWTFVRKLIEGIVMYDLRPSRFLTSLWYRGEPQRTMTHLLDCLENQRVAFDKHFNDYNEFTLKKMLGFLFYNENYRSHLEIFLKFLSRSKFYSVDWNFANLLMAVFRSEKHETSGRIAKTLDILHALGLRPLLVELYGVVLTMDPEAFRNIYQPVLLEKKDALLANFHSLLERDPYGMTHLHGAAFYGNIEIVDQIFATIRQKQLRYHYEVEPVVPPVMFKGYTPFFLAAARGHEKICCSILAFLKEGLSWLSWNSTDNLNRSLKHAMKSDNLEMLRLILKVVKKELGHDYLLNFLKEKFVMESCSSKEMFEAMAKIIVDRDGIVDYKYLGELIFNQKDETLRDALQYIHGEYYKVTLMSYIDAENLQGLLSLEGTNTFAKRILCKKYGPSHNFSIFSKFLLRNLNKEQLFDCVEMITRLGDTKIVESDWTKAFPTYYSSQDPSGSSNGKRSIKPVQNLRSNSKSIFSLNNNVTSTVHSDRVVPRSSFWKDFLRSSINSLNNTVISSEDESCILECLTCISDKLGGDYAKELLLHQDDDGYVVTYLSQEIVKRMLNCLPEKSQEEIKQEWKLNVPPMAHDSFIPLDSSTNTLSSRAIARHYSDVLRFYLDYGSDVKLKECVNILTYVRLIDEQQRSVWSYIFEYCERKSNELLKSMLVIFGREAMKELLLHKIDGFALILKAVLWKDDIIRWLEMVPQEIRNDIQQVIELQAAEFIEEVFLNHEAYVKKLGHPYVQHLLSTLTFFLNDSNDGQLKQFVQSITTLHISPDISSQMKRRLSIWADMLVHQHYWDEDYITKMDRFLKCIKEKLGLNAVKELVLRKSDDIPVICWVALRGEEKILEAMLTNLDAKSRKKIQRQVNEFLDVAFHVPSDGVVTNAMLEALKFPAFLITL